MHSKQDLKYAAQLREEIHREALAIVRKTHPNATKVIDRHPVEDYFQESREYPGKLYTVVAIPYGYKSRQALVDTIVRNTLSGEVPKTERTYTGEIKNTGSEDYDRLNEEPKKDVDREKDPFYTLLAQYPDTVVDYCIIKGEHYCGYASHKGALKVAYNRICAGWNGDPAKASCKGITTWDKLLSEPEDKKLSYRKAFLCPPHGSSYTDGDFKRINAALFPGGTDNSEVYKWSTDWSEYFDEGREWWGTLCLTVYDKNLDRFAVIMASATD